MFLIGILERPTPPITCGMRRREPCSVCNARDDANRQVDRLIRHHGFPARMPVDLDEKKESDEEAR